ncbi:MAG: LPXTG cell wall anchor domain-containing protein [Verrucomicrobiales bacterium]|nr:LPXTG cell wall anchor domain-containing protein [Verrucomicrobiales bacterium]
MNLLLTLALVATRPKTELPRTAPGAGEDTMPILIAIGVVGLLLILGVVWWARRRHSRRQHRRRSVSSRPSVPPVRAESRAEGDVEATSAHRHRRRRRRRDHRPRNPTLAETGGLPPPRPEGQTPTGL